jgi:hypothetical protein
VRFAGRLAAFLAVRFAGRFLAAFFAVRFAGRLAAFLTVRFAGRFAAFLAAVRFAGRFFAAFFAVFRATATLPPESMSGASLQHSSVKLWQSMPEKPWIFTSEVSFVSQMRAIVSPVFSGRIQHHVT